MTIKKIISVGLCILTISTLTTLPASAAKSADFGDCQIISKVRLFNESKLKKLSQYILCANFDDFIKKELMTLYQKLDNLVVSNISVANELNETTNSGNSNSIGRQLENIFSFVDTINQKYCNDQFKKTNSNDSLCYLTANLDTKIRTLITRIDKINNSQNNI